MIEIYKNTIELSVEYDIVSSICDIFDAYLINEEHGTEYLIMESNKFHKELVQLFEKEDKI